MAQPSTFIEPSGRSAMICSVLVAPPIRRRRTSRNPAASTAGAMSGSRWAICDIMRKTPINQWLPGAAILSDRPTTKRLLYGIAAMYAAKGLNSRVAAGRHGLGRRWLRAAVRRNGPDRLTLADADHDFARLH